MRTLLDFSQEIVNLTSAIRKQCKDELTAMREAYCKHKYIELIESDHEYPYFQHWTRNDDFKINTGNSVCDVCAVRYYPDEDEWCLMLKTLDGYHIEDEVCVEDLNISELIDFVYMLKVDVFNDYYCVEEPDSKIESNEPMSEKLSGNRRCGIVRDIVEKVW